MGRLEGLDGLRGIAALCVLVFHATQTFGTTRYLPVGPLAVDFFFVLSGYVMARSYEPRLRDGSGAFQFISIRFWRFWPTMLLGALLGLPLLLQLLGPWGLVIALLNVFFIPVPFGTRLFPVNTPFWSLFIEFVANIAHAFVFWRLSTRQLLAVIVALVLVMLAIGINTGALNIGNRFSALLPGFARAALSYLIGICLCRILQDKPPFRLPSLLTALLIPLALTPHGPWLYELAFIVLIAPFALVAGLSADFGKLGATAGRISFPLYATHLPVLRYAEAMGLPMVAGIVLSLIAAYATTWLLELKLFKSRRSGLKA